MKYLFSLTLVFSFLFGYSQNQALKNIDYTYLDNIKSVRFHIQGLMTSLPMVNLGSSTKLLLSFDDFDEDVKNYTYTIIHCNQDWTPSDLAEMEYIDGFTEEQILDYRFSFKAITDYTHFELSLPNDDMSWTKSGNYLLIVYEDEEERIPAITRRFMVVDQQVNILPQMVRPAKVSKMRTHQEIDFTVNTKKLQVRSPRQEISATVLQNGRWDNALTNIPPIFKRPKEIVFDYQDKIIFPAGNEFRFMDLRSLRRPFDRVAELQEYEDRFDVYLTKDEKRLNRPHSLIQDLNGNYVIENFDQVDDPNLTGNYANVWFFLYSPDKLFDYDVYLFGAFSEWQLRPELKMEYNPAVNSYVGKAFLKQGFYDYTYAVVKRQGEDKKPKLAEIEGNWFEANNQYTILIYYRPFGSRYDQLIGKSGFSSSL